MSVLNKVTDWITAVYKPESRKYAVVVVGMLSVLVVNNLVDQTFADEVIALLTALGVYEVKNS